MLADRPPIVGNQTGMDGFTGFGGQMGGHVGNQTDALVTSGMRGAVAQYGVAGYNGVPTESVGAGIKVPVPGDKDEVLTGGASQLAPTEGARGKMSFLDGHAFLIIAGVGAIALAIWGWK